MSELLYFLGARPSILEGIARVLDVGGTMQEYNQSSTPEQADERAFAADLIAVNRDFAAMIAREVPESS